MSGENNTEMDKLAEKRLISAWAENQWPVKLTQKLFDVHGHWLDNQTRQQFESELNDLSSDLEQLEDNFETQDGGYDTEAIRDLSIHERKQISQELYSNTEDALDLFDQLYHRVEGHYDVGSEIPDMIDQSVRNTFNELIDEGDLNVSVTTDIDDNTLNQIYNRVEQSIEANLGPTVDQDTMDDIYDQLTDLEDEIERQGRQTRQHVTDEHDRTRSYVGDEHTQTRDYVGSEHTSTRDTVSSEHDQTRDKLDDIENKLDGGNGPSTSRRGLLAKIAVLLGGTYLVAEQLHDGDELTNITWDDADRELNGGNNGGAPTDQPNSYSATWDNNSISKWNSFVERVPGEVDEVYTESATGQQYVVVENENDQAFQVSYQELGLDKQEEASLETSDNYLEFFGMEE